VLYRIKSTAAVHAAHPLHPEPVTESAADRILQGQASYADISVSARVAGTTKVVPVFGSEFFPCEAAGWTALKNHLMSADCPLRGFVRSAFINPFSASLAKGLDNGRYKGNLRGFRVLDYETQVKRSGWGITGPGGSTRLTICYRGTTLGIAVRYDTGATERISDMHAVKSMYGVA